MFLNYQKVDPYFIIFETLFNFFFFILPFFSDKIESNTIISFFVILYYIILHTNLYFIYINIIIVLSSVLFNFNIHLNIDINYILTLHIYIYISKNFIFLSFSFFFRSFLHYYVYRDFYIHNLLLITYIDLNELLSAYFNALNIFSKSNILLICLRRPTCPLLTYDISPIEFISKYFIDEGGGGFWRGRRSKSNKTEEKKKFR